MPQAFGKKALVPLSGAIIEGDYRYKLWRCWDSNPEQKTIVWVMLNPSTADGETDDATIRKCRSFSKRWGYHRLEVVNLFALRATDPDAMKAHSEPVGPRNNAFLAEAAASRNTIVCAWGNDGQHLKRDREVVLDVFGNQALFCLGANSNMSPKHPLYLALTLPLQPWTLSGAGNPIRVGRNPEEVLRER